MPQNPPITGLLQSLVRIPSVNPDGDPGVSPGGEKHMADFIADFLKPHGFTIIQEESLPGRPNLIARAPAHPGDDARPRILLGPHLDTVGIAGMTIDPFSADLSDGKIHGRGTSDTKGPMAAMLWALAENSHLLADLPVAIDFIGFMGEESSQPGSKHFADHHAHEYEFAIIGEPTSLEAVHCTKGSLWTTLTATGKAAHSSQPHLGENAILKLTRCLDHLDRRLSPHLATHTHDILGHATLNIGQINGGTRPNIVPDHASAVIDIRTVPSLVEKESCASFLEKFLLTHAHEVTMEESDENPPMEVSPDHPWLKKLQQIHPQMPLTGAPWFSDAAHLSAAGLPSICLGPGSIDQAHTKDEFITTNDLEAGGEFFSKLILGLA